MLKQNGTKPIEEDDCLKQLFSFDPHPIKFVILSIQVQQNMHVPDGGRFSIHALLVFTLSAIPRLLTSPACSALSESLCSFQKCLSSSEAATVAAALMWVRETAVSPHLSAFMAPWRLTLSPCLLNWDWSQQRAQRVAHTHLKNCAFSDSRTGLAAEERHH